MSANNRRHSTESRRTTSARSYSSNGSTRAGSTRTAATRNAPNNNNRNSGRGGGVNIAGLISVVLVAIIVIAGIAGVLIYTNVKYLYDETTIVPGVVVEGIDLGGMTQEEALNALNNKLVEKTNQLLITIRHNELYWSYNAASLNTSGDITDIVNTVITYGHTGKLQDRMDQAEYVLNNTENFSISFAYDQNSVRQIVETLKMDIDMPAVEPTLEFDKDVGKITYVDDLAAQLYNPLKYDTAIYVNDVPSEVYIDANGNPAINADIFTITAGSSGYEVDVDATVNAIINDLSDDSVADVQLVTYDVHPEYTQADLQDFTSLVYHSKSYLAFTSTYNRDRNVAHALEAFDGMVIMPGEVVSFNETTGERSEANGYYLAPTIAQDKSHKEDWGGGVCQAATIIFNAAIMSGCEVIDKESHSWPLYNSARDYGSDARDAMVNWSTSDLQFKNVTDYPIYFDTSVHWYSSDNATWGYCNAYTKLLDNNQSIKYKPSLVLTEPAPEPEYIPLENENDYADANWRWNEELGLLTYEYSPSKPLKHYDVYQLILDENNNIVSETMWYRSHYDALQGTYYTKPDTDRDSDDSVG